MFYCVSSVDIVFICCCSILFLTLSMLYQIYFISFLVCLYVSLCLHWNTQTLSTSIQSFLVLCDISYLWLLFLFCPCVVCVFVVDILFLSRHFAVSLWSTYSHKPNLLLPLNFPFLLFFRKKKSYKWLTTDDYKFKERKTIYFFYLKFF